MADRSESPSPEAEEAAPLQTTALVAPPSAPTQSNAARALAVGAIALGSFALGAVAIGAFAIGIVAIGRLRIGAADAGRLRIGRLEIDELLVRKALAPSGRVGG